MSRSARPRPAQPSIGVVRPVAIVLAALLGAMAAAPVLAAGPAPAIAIVPTVTTVALSQSSVTVGDTITITATVTATPIPGAPTHEPIPGDPSGTVVFGYCLNRSLPLGTCAEADKTVIGTPVTVGTANPGNGVVTASIDWVPAPGYGYYTLWVGYGGDDWFMASANDVTAFFVDDPSLVGTPTLDVPQRYTAGKRITVCVHHALAGSEVGFQVRDWGFQKTVAVGDDGTACVTFRIPASAYPGIYVLGAVVKSETWQTLYLTTRLVFPPSTCCGLPDTSAAGAALVAGHDTGRLDWILALLAFGAGAGLWTHRMARRR